MLGGRGCSSPCRSDEADRHADAGSPALSDELQCIVHRLGRRPGIVALICSVTLTCTLWYGAFNVAMVARTGGAFRNGSAQL